MSHESVMDDMREKVEDLRRAVGGGAVQAVGFVVLAADGRLSYSIAGRVEASGATMMVGGLRLMETWLLSAALADNDEPQVLN